MQEMGMTDAQFKDYLRLQLEQWEDVKEVIECENESASKERAMKICQRNIDRINTSLQD